MTAGRILATMALLTAALAYLVVAMESTHTERLDEDVQAVAELLVGAGATDAFSHNLRTILVDEACGDRREPDEHGDRQPSRHGCLSCGAVVGCDGGVAVEARDDPGLAVAVDDGRGIARDLEQGLPDGEDRLARRRDGEPE